MSGKGRVSQTQSVRNLFSSDVKFYNDANRVMTPYRELFIGSMSSSRFMELPESFKGVGATRQRGKYLTRTPWFSAGTASEVIKLKNLNEMVLQMVVSAHQLSLAAESYRIVLAQRALMVFRGSFEQKRFNSSGSPKWHTISRWTMHKRMYAGAWPIRGKNGKYIRPPKKSKYSGKSTWKGAGGLLEEHNRYMQMNTNVKFGPNTSGVKALSDYSGYHNDPKSSDTHGDGWGGVFHPLKNIRRRQFMGHSTLMDDFINKYEKRYLFDTIFRAPTRKK